MGGCDYTANRDSNNFQVFFSLLCHILENSGCRHLLERRQDMFFNHSTFMLTSEHGIRDEDIIGTDIFSDEFTDFWHLYGSILADIPMTDGNFYFRTFHERVFFFSTTEREKTTNAILA